MKKEWREGETERKSKVKCGKEEMHMHGYVWASAKEANMYLYAVCTVIVIELAAEHEFKPTRRRSDTSTSILLSN